ncbi:MAG: HAD family hydrolase [Deltaproteobacteria bacterium]|jgi:phosphoglycolate phosphatase|nr:HAD family hydrolase [Deltaproteobacteria bacterium]
MHNERIEAIVFDFDGTLAELHIDFLAMKRHVGALAEEYLQTRLPLPPQPALEWLENLQREIRKNDPSLANEFQRRASSLIMELELEAADRGSLFPFTRRILAILSDRGVKTGIITRNCEKAVTKVFPDMGGFCSAFLAREHVLRVKPHPEHLHRALEKLMAAPAAALMVGDHPMDIQTGRSAGTLTAGVLSGNSSRTDLIASGAHWTASDCEELLNVLIAEKIV